MHKQIKFDGGNISYRVIGKGKPAILIHGFGEDSNVWHNQVTELSEKNTLILPDLPGSGQSSIINDMSIEGMAEVIHEIIHHENVELCPVIGHSMGGYITLALVEKYYNHISAFGLFHSSAYADSEEKIAARKKGIAFIEENGAAAFLKTSVPNLFSQKSKDEKPEIVDELMEGIHNFLPQSLVLYYKAMINRPDRTDLLKRKNAPVLFVIGEYDTAIPKDDMLKQSHLPEKSYIHLLKYSGHMGMLEEPDLSTTILKQFLEDNC